MILAVLLIVAAGTLFLMKRRAIFSGSDVEHNRDALRFILHRLAPQLQNEYAFVIHGGCGKSFVNSLIDLPFAISPENCLADNFQ